MDNIKLDIRGIAKGILDFVQDREGDGTFEICWWNFMFFRMSGMSWLAWELLIRDYGDLRMVCDLLTYPLYFYFNLNIWFFYV